MQITLLQSWRKKAYMRFERAAQAQEIEAAMGIAIPRPQMRSRERRRVEEVLRHHAELMRRLEAEGMTREEASRRAFFLVKSGVKPETQIVLAGVTNNR